MIISPPTISIVLGELQAGLFTLIEEGLDEDDEYEFYQPGSLVIAVWDGQIFKVAGEAEAEALDPGALGFP